MRTAVVLFNLGGPESHRGFNFNRLSLQIPSGIKGSPAIPVGGDEMFLTQVELRVRAVLLFGAWLELAGFVDAGDVAAPTGLLHRGQTPLCRSERTGT